MSLPKIPTLSALTWVEARDILQLRPVGLLPIGAIEAHGPHLPLDTDAIIAQAMAATGGLAIRQSGIPALILPAVQYSVSFAGACFPGTMPVSSAALGAYLDDILRFHASQGYRAICICNAHLEPAHVEVVSRVATTATTHAGIPVIFPDQRQEPWASRLGDEFAAGSRHAGKYETSIVLAASPDSVRHTEMEELQPVWIDLPAALKAGARDFAEAGADQGYFGDPAAATEDHGLALLEILGEMIRERTMQALVSSGK